MTTAPLVATAALLGLGLGLGVAVAVAVAVAVGGHRRRGRNGSLAGGRAAGVARAFRARAEQGLAVFLTLLVVCSTLTAPVTAGHGGGATAAPTGDAPDDGRAGAADSGGTTSASDGTAGTGQTDGARGGPASVSASGANSTTESVDPDYGNTGFQPWYLSVRNVSTANGNLFRTATDLSVRARGGNLTFARSYNSHLSAEHGPLGFGWTHNYNMQLVERANGSVVFVANDGARHAFTPTGDGYEAPPGVHMRLRETDGGFALDRLSGHSMHFDADGTLQSIEDKNGNQVTLEYTNDRLTAIRDDSGQQLTLTYTAEGRISSVSDPLGRTVHYRYAAGDLVEVVDVMGNSVTYTYYENHKLKQVEGPTGAPTLYTYYTGSDRVRCVGSTLVSNTCAETGTVFEYDYANDTVTIERGISGNTTRITLNDAGNPVAIDHPLGGAELAWDDDMNRVLVRNDSGTRRYAYDDYGHVVRRTGILNNTVRFGWQTIVTNDTYIALLANRTGPRGYTTRYRYDQHGNRIKVTNPRGATRTSRYNEFGYKTAETDFDGHTTRYTYNDHGFRTAVIDPTGATTNFTYDAAGRLVARTDPLGNTRRFVRNARGDIVKVVDATGNETEFTYDDTGFLIGATTATGQEIPAGAPWQPAPDTGTTIDRSGRTTTIRTDDHAITRRSDARGRPVSVSVDFGPFTRHLNYTYEGGNLVAVERPGGTTRYEYDELDRVTRIGGPNGTWVNYTYNGADQPTKAVYSNGVTTHYEYDAAGRVLGVRVVGPSDLATANQQSTETATATATLATNSTATPTATATSTAAGTRTATATSDGESGPTARATTTGTGTVLLNYTYTYDEDGNRLTATDTDGDVTRYGYDAVGRLVNVTYPSGKTVTYTYDANGNRLSKTVNGSRTIRYDYDNEGELEEVRRPGTDTVYTYGSDGMLRQKEVGANTTTYDYGPRGRLQRVEPPDGDPISFTYLPSGERVSKTTGGNTTYYLSSFFDVVAAFDENGSLARQYLHGPGVDNPVSLVRDGEAYFYHQDGPTNVRALTNASGRVVNRYRYTAFGSLRGATEGVSNPYRYAARRHDAEAGLYYNRHRYYDPEVGRFTKRDPAGLSGGLNLYRYADNNPVNFRDPSGLATWTGTVATAGAMVAIVGAGQQAGTLQQFSSGQSCDIWVFNIKIGLGLGASGGVQKIAAIGAPRCGKNLGGASVSAYVAAAAGPAQGSASAGTGGGTVTAGGGVSTGGKIEGGVSFGVVSVIDCTCNCDCASGDGSNNPHCADGQCDDNDDNPDDNHDLSVLSYSRQFPSGGQGPPEFNYQGASVAVLNRGFSAQLNDFLVSNGETPASVGFTVSQERLNRFNVLVVPSGSLQGISTLASVERKLERFVEQGGTLVVLPQKYGYELEPVPGDLAGFGWREDQSCQFGSVGINSFCSVLASQDDAVASINVDGYFTDYPENATVLLTRTKNGQPAMLKYGYGEGRVLATAAYTDWAYGQFQSHPEGEALLEDMVQWAKQPGNVTTHAPRERVTFAVNLTSYIDMHADGLRMELVDPTGTVRRTVSLSRNLSSFENHTAKFTTTVPDGATHGLWSVQYALVNDSHGVVQQGRSPGHFAVSTLQQSGDGWTYQRSNLSLSVASSGENFAEGANATFTITVRNRNETAENVTVWWTLPDNFAETNDALQYGAGTTSPRPQGLSRTLEVPAGGERTITHQVPLIDSDVLYATLYRGNRSSRDLAGRASKFVRTFRPSVNVDVGTDSQRYTPGEQVSLDLTVADSNTPLSTAVDVRVVNPENRLVHEERVNATIAPDETSQQSINVTLPVSAVGGHYTVVADARRDGQRIGYAENQFVVPSPIPGVTPSVPGAVRNGSRLNFTVRNLGQRDLSNATLSVSLTNPTNTRVWNASTPVSVAPSEREQVTLRMETGPSLLGAYHLQYALEYGNGSRATRVVTLENDLTASVSFDRPAHDAGETATAGVTVTNDGRFAGTQRVTVGVPEAGFEETRQVQLAPGGSTTLEYAVSLPETISGGAHGTVTVAMANETTRDLGLFVRPSKLSLSMSESSYAAGETIPITLVNDGGATTTASCTVRLYDTRSVAVSENRTQPRLGPGERVTLTAAIPDQAVGGTYYPEATCENGNRDTKAYLLKSVSVAGLNASVTASTGAETYTSGENVTVTVEVTNDGPAIQNGTLQVRVTNASDGTDTSGGTSTQSVGPPSRERLANAGSIAGASTHSRSGSRATTASTERAVAPSTERPATARQSTATVEEDSLSVRSDPPTRDSSLRSDGERTDDGSRVQGAARHPAVSPRSATVSQQSATVSQQSATVSQQSATVSQQSATVDPAATTATTGVDNRTVWADETVTTNESIVVNASGNLTLRNATLRFDPDQDMGIGIEVRSGGELHVLNGSTVENANTNRYLFRARPGSRLEARDSTVRDAADDYEPLDREGVYVGTSNTTVQNVTFQNNGDTDLVLENVTGVTVAESSFDGELQLHDTQAVDALDNDFSIENTGVTLDNASGTELRNSTFSDSGTAVRLRGSSANNSLVNNTISDSGIRLRGGSANNSLVNNTISGDNIEIRGSSTDNSLVNNTISNTDFRRAVSVREGSNRTVVRSNDVDQTEGIEVASSHAVVTDNEVTDSADFGITVSGQNVTLRNNTVSGSGTFDVLLQSAVNATLRNNTLVESFHVTASGRWGPPAATTSTGALRYYDHDIDTSNTVDGEPLEYRVDERGRTVRNDGGMLWLVNATDVTVRGSGPVYVARSTGVTVRNVNASGGYYGVFAAYSNRTTIENTTTANALYGIVVFGAEGAWRSTGNVLAGNDVNDTAGYGLYLRAVADTTVRDTDAHNSGGDSDEGMSLSGVNLTVTDNDVRNSGGRYAHAVELTGSNVTVSRNTVTGHGGEFGGGDAAIAVSGGNNTIADNALPDNNNGGILVSSSSFGDRNNTVSGNSLRDTLKQIVVETDATTVADNNISASSVFADNRDGVVVTEFAENVSVVGNNISGGRDIDDGIRLRGASPEVRNNTVTNTRDEGTGINLFGTTSATVVGNNVSDNNIGIRLNELDSGTVRDNYGDNRVGIVLTTSVNVSLRNNTVRGSDASIRLVDTQRTTLRHNALGQGGLDIPHDASSTVGDFTHDIDTTNTYRGDPIYYLVGANDTTVPADAGAAWLVDSQNVTVNGGHQAIAAFSNNVTVQNVTATNLVRGVALLETDDSTVRNTTVRDSNGERNGEERGIGVLVRSATGNALQNLTVHNSSKHGIRLTAAPDNRLANVTVTVTGREGGGRFVQNSAGIYLGTASVSNRLVGINATANGDGTDDDYGIYLGSNDNLLTDTVTNRHPDYGIGVAGNDNTITDTRSEGDDIGVWITGARNDVANVTTDGGDTGFLVHGDDNTVRNVTAVGFFLDYQESILFEDDAFNNTVTASNLSDVTFSSGTNNTIVGNYVFSAVDAGSTTGNLFYDNYFDDFVTIDDEFSDNRWNVTRQPTVEGNIIGGRYLGGNFWADYDGRDLNGDGLGDTKVPYGPGDHHPLVPAQNTTESTGPGVWSANATIDVAADGTRTLEFTVPASALESGKFKLSSTLLSQTNQTVAIEDPAFYVVEGDTTVTLAPDKQVYRPNETVNLSGTVENTGSSARTYTLTVTRDETELLGDSVTLAPGGTETYSVTTRATSSFTATASAGTATVSDRVQVSPPAVNTTLVAPDVVGRAPFTAGVRLQNTGDVPVTLDIAIANQSQGTVTLDPGATRLVERTLAINETTAVNVTIRGDVNRTLGQQVTFGERVDVAVSPEQAYTPGSVVIPYTVTNTGQLESNFTLTVTLAGRTIQRDVYIGPDSETSDHLRVDLAAGNYTLDYASPFGTNQTTVRVAERNQIELAVTDVGSVTDAGRLPVNVTLENTGPNDVAGTLRANATVLADTREFNVSAGASRTLALSLDVADAARAGEYNLSVEAITEGTAVANATTQFTVTRPRFAVVAAPSNPAVQVDETTTLNVTVANVGGDTGRGTLNVTSPGIHQSESTVWLAPGERTNVSVTFGVPPDLETGRYDLTYEASDTRTTTDLVVAGLNATATASLDQRVYEAGDNATLTVEVTNLESQNASLLSRVKHNDYEAVEEYTLGGGETTTLTFEVPVTFDGPDEKIFYSVYAQSGRSLYINGIRPHRNQSRNVTVSTDQPVYDIGDTATVTVTAHAAGNVSVSAPGLAWRDTLNKSETRRLTFTVPALSSGTHYVHYAFENRSYSYPFDVDGYHVRLVEAGFEDEQIAGGERVTFTATVEPNRAVSANVTTRIYTPEGRVVNTSQQHVALAAGEDTVTITARLPQDAAGIHAFTYRIDGQVASSSVELMQDTHYFEVRANATNVAPLAALSYAPSRPVVGETVTFDANASSDPDGTITRYAWDFDNDSQVDARGETATHAFDTSGTHAVRLRVTDDDGQTNATTQTVTVEAAAEPPTDGGDVPGGTGGGADAGGTDRPTTTPTGTDTRAIGVVSTDFGTTTTVVGERLTLTATLENTGATSTTETVRLFVDGEYAGESRIVTLGPGETTTVEVTTTFDRPGTYSVRLGTAPAVTITVDGPPTTGAQPTTTPATATAPPTTQEPTPRPGTPTVTPTATGPPTEAPTGTDAGGAGFTALAAVVAVLGAALLARRRR